jgi:hypothetical protein
METIFDHHVTQHELFLLRYFNPFDEVRKEVEKVQNQDIHFRMISNLYKYRNLYGKGFEYANKIVDKNLQDKPVETVFDHNITEKELSYLYDNSSKVKHKRILNNQDQDFHFQEISTLYQFCRDDYLNAYTYAGKIENLKLRVGRFTNIKLQELDMV